MSDWNFVTSLFVERPPNPEQRPASQLWKLAPTANRLVVVVSSSPSLEGSLVIAYGVNPDDPPNSDPVFWRKLPRETLGAFLKSLFDGDSGEAASAVTNSVVIRHPDPTPPGPKADLVLLYAKTLPAGEEILGLDAA